MRNFETLKRNGVIKAPKA